MSQVGVESFVNEEDLQEIYFRKIIDSLSPLGKRIALEYLEKLVRHEQLANKDFMVDCYGCDYLLIERKIYVPTTEDYNECKCNLKSIGIDCVHTMRLCRFKQVTPV
jgi:hypothetical protein